MPRSDRQETSDLARDSDLGDSYGHTGSNRPRTFAYIKGMCTLDAQNCDAGDEEKPGPIFRQKSIFDAGELQGSI